MILALGKVSDTQQAIFKAKKKTRVDSVLYYSLGASQNIRSYLGNEALGASVQIAKHVRDADESAELIDLQEGDRSTFGPGDCIEAITSTAATVNFVVIGEVLE